MRKQFLADSLESFEKGKRKCKFYLLWSEQRAALLCMLAELVNTKGGKWANIVVI